MQEKAAQAPRELGVITITELHRHGLVSLEIASDALNDPSPRKAWTDTVFLFIVVAIICFARGTTLMYVMPLVAWLAFGNARESWSEHLEDKREHEIALNVCRDALEEFEAQR